jgi:hypothetical protein
MSSKRYGEEFRIEAVKQITERHGRGICSARSVAAQFVVKAVKNVKDEMQFRWQYLMPFEAKHLTKYSCCPRVTRVALLA